jgi:hypothetical protein
VDEFAPMSFEKEIFHHYALFDSIHSNIHNGSSPIYWMRIKNALSVRPSRQILSLNTCDWFRNWFSSKDAIRLLRILSLEKDKQGIKYVFANLWIKRIYKGVDLPKNSSILQTGTKTLWLICTRIEMAQKSIWWFLAKNGFTLRHMKNEMKGVSAKNRVHSSKIMKDLRERTLGSSQMS